MLKKFLQKDMKNFLRGVDGAILCPTGDYSGIMIFEERCQFGGESIFGDRSFFADSCWFGNDCHFGDGSRFGNGCRFGERSSFGKGNSFGKECSFGDMCDFSTMCTFDEMCKFGMWNIFCERSDFAANCTFGGDSRFGELCTFGENCSHEGLTNSKLFACDRIGEELRKIYFFRADEGYFVRDWRFFGTIDEFVAMVNEKHGDAKHQREYLAAVELAKIVLGDE